MDWCFSGKDDFGSFTPRVGKECILEFAGGSIGSVKRVEGECKYMKDSFVLRLDFSDLTELTTLLCRFPVRLSIME